MRIHHGGPDDGALAQSVVVGPSDSILPVGYCGVGLTADQDFMIARLDASGALAPGFGQ